MSRLPILAKLKKGDDVELFLIPNTLPSGLPFNESLNAETQSNLKLQENFSKSPISLSVTKVSKRAKP